MSYEIPLKKIIARGSTNYICLCMYPWSHHVCIYMRIYINYKERSSNVEKRERERVGGHSRLKILLRSSNVGP